MTINVNCSILNQIVKIKLIKTFLLIMPCRFSNDLLALKKYRILHIEKLTNNKKNGHQTFNENSADIR